MLYSLVLDRTYSLTVVADTATGFMAHAPCKLYGSVRVETQIRLGSGSADFFQKKSPIHSEARGRRRRHHRTADRTIIFDRKYHTWIASLIIDRSTYVCCSVECRTALW